MRKYIALYVSLFLALLVLPGCTTPTDLPTLATPERIQAVTALGAYYAGNAVIADGKRVVLQSARDALVVIAASDKVDLVAVTAALHAAGIDFFESEDGKLTMGAVLVFTDLWSNTVGQTLSDERVHAAIVGILRGFDAALAASSTKVRFVPNLAAATLQQDVLDTRPAR